MVVQDSPEDALWQSIPVPRTGRHRRVKRHALLLPAFIPLILVSGLLLNWVALIPVAFALPAAGTSTPGQNTYQHFLKESQVQGKPHPFQRPSLPSNVVHPNAPQITSKTASTLKHLPSVEPATMADQTYTLDDSFVLHRPATRTVRNLPSNQLQGTAIPAGTTPLVSTGSDGRLEVDVPRGSLDFAHATLADGSAPVGQVLLQIHQTSGHYIGAESILGTYVLQIVDSQGDVIQGVQLIHPITLRYHYQTWEVSDLNINPSEVHLAWLDPLAKAQSARNSVNGLMVPMTNNSKTHTLTAQSSLLAGPLTVSAPPEINAPATPDLFEASGNSGQYSYSYPIAVAPGPNGFTPQLQLAYSSQGTNERHNRRAPASAEGEGFSLALGSITSAIYPSSSTGGAAVWYFLSGVDGVSDRLVPSTTANFYETQHLSHLLIEWTGSCWNVWGLDGSYSQLGCTSDSVRTGVLGNYEWDLNETLAMLPQGSPNQAALIQVSYLQDMNGSTTRDAQIKQIVYGYATENPLAFTHIAGTVDFHYHMPSVPSGQSAFATAYGTNYNCASAPPFSTTLRCDDPPAFNNVPAPDVMSTMSLDSITSYVGADSANQPAYQYRFTYQDQPFVTNFWNPGGNETAATAHLLTQITPTVYVQGNAHTRQPVIFGYTPGLHISFFDPIQGHLGGQTWWPYLNHYQDQATGVGANISYQEAFGNLTGTPYITDSQGNIVDDRFDPLYCTNQSNNSDQSKQCTGVYSQPGAYAWSVQVVTQISALGTDSSGNPTVSTTTYHYSLTSVPAGNSPASCNPMSGSGVPAQEADCVMDNWSPGYNGTPTPQHDADWADYYHAEFRGFAAVYITSAAGNLTADLYMTTDGWWVPDLGDNASAGQLYQQDIYQGNVASSQALLRETIHDYVNASFPAGNPYTHLNECNGNENPVYIPCVAAPILSKTTFFERQGGSTTAPWVQTVDTYDDLNGTQGFTYTTSYHNLLQEVVTSSNAPTITRKWSYAVTNQTINGWVYFNVDKVSHSEIDDSSGHVWACQDTLYDEGAVSGTPTPDEGLATTTKTYSTCGNSSTAMTSYIAYDQFGQPVATVDPLVAANPSLYSSTNQTGCTVSTVAQVSPAWTAGRFTSCTTYDTTHTAILPTSTTNALGQTSSTTYDSTSGAQPVSLTDANGQITSFSYAYDQWGNETINLKQPGETGSYTTRQVEGTKCASLGDALPCYQIASNSSLYGSVMSRTFYDALGRAVETRTPGPTPGDDTVVMTVYNDQQNSVWKSVPFQVSDASVGTNYLDPNGAKDINGVAPAGTTTFSDALGRTLAVQDPNFGSTQEPGLACSQTLSGKYTSCINYGFSDPFDATIYSFAWHTDANGHQVFTWADALGQNVGSGTFSGIYPDDSVAQLITEIRYNALGKPTVVLAVDEHFPTGGQSIVTTTMTYDDQGRLLTLTDPDQGTFSYSYDPDGHVIATTQTSGPNARTVGVNYDLLGRVGCEQTAAPTLNATGACSAGNPLVQNTYDIPEDGWVNGTNDFPVGRLSRSNASTYYPDGTSALVGEDVRYDQRGRVVEQAMGLQLPSSWNVTNAIPTSDELLSYNDANQPTTTTTQEGSEGYTFTQVYDPTTGSLQGISNTGTSTANLATLAYNEYAQVSGLTLLNGAGSSPASIASEQFSYDANLRPTSLTANWLPPSGNSGQILSQGRAYDNASNVTSVNTTMAAVPGKTGTGGSETQNFCYDEQNRLLWSGNGNWSKGSPQPGAGNGTCGTGTLGGTIGGSAYTNAFSYTNLGQIWQGPVAGQWTSEQYLYCNSAPHQVSGIYPVGTTCANKGSATAVYSASYDPWGNIISRTYNGTTATLSYDMLNHLVTWDAGSAGQEWYAYDASGTRVFKRSISSNGTRLTTYAFGLQELGYSHNGFVVGQIDYYSLAGHLIGSTDGTSTTYDLTDAQGSVLTSLSSTAVLGEQMYSPYGTQRYIAGTMGTSRGYTGQVNDDVTGLDYYNARYYDPAAGVFLSPDSVQGNAQGMDPYAYVAGNPETNVDPTGNRYFCPDGCGSGGDDPEPPGNTGCINCIDGPPDPSSASPTSGSGTIKHKQCDAVCKANDLNKAVTKGTKAKIDLGHLADGLTPYIDDFNSGSLMTIAGAIISFFTKDFPAFLAFLKIATPPAWVTELGGWLEKGGTWALVAIGFQLTILGKAIAEQLKVLQTTWKTLASDLGSEDKATGWTIQGLWNFRDQENGYIQDQNNSLWFEQAVISSFGNNDIPFGDFMNRGMNFLFGMTKQYMTNLIGDQVGDIMDSEGGNPMNG